MVFGKYWGRVNKILAKWIFILIHRRYGCCIFRNAEVGRGFYIAHPVGIVIGKCKIGEDFMICQNCTVGIRRGGEEALGLTPTIGNRVTLTSGSMIFGKVEIADDVTIAAGSIVLNDICEAGTYVGCPVRKVKEKSM